MLEVDIFDWFKNNDFDIVLSIPSKKAIVIFAINKYGSRYTATGDSVFSALINLKELIEN